MAKKLIQLALSCAVFVMMCSVSFAGEQDTTCFEVPSSTIKVFSVNHEQGSIDFMINNIYYFYYVQAKESAERILATSSLLADIRNASTIQIKSEQYGLHRKIINLLLFYGDRVIPDNLKEIPSKEKTSEK